MFQNYEVVMTFNYPSSVIGLSGGIGCGKSTALKIFSELECTIIESDKIVHELYEENSEDSARFRKILTDKWGNEVLTEGNLDRKKIGKIVFTNKNALEWLNSNTHPYVFSRAEMIIKASPKSRIIIFDIPLLFELGIEKDFSSTIAIWTNKEQQTKRLKARNWTEHEIYERIKNQLTPDIKLERASYGIINTGDLNYLKEQCKQILIKITKKINQKDGK